MGYSLRPETMEKISKAQEPAFVDSETNMRITVQSAMLLIKSALDDGNPGMVRRGVQKLIQACYGFELSESDMLLLAARKAIYVEQVEKLSYGNE